jgi:hypothetical protein
VDFPEPAAPASTTTTGSGSRASVIPEVWQQTAHAILTVP